MESDATLTVPTTPVSPAVTAHASGPVPYRTLVLGGAGVVEADEAAFAEAFAARVLDGTGHGVDVAMESGVDLLVPTGSLAGRDLSRVDALIAVLDPGGVVEQPTTRVQELVRDLVDRLTTGAALVLVVPAHRSSAASTRVLDRFTAVVRETADPLTPVVRLDELPGSSAAERTAAWAATIARAASAAMIEPLVRFVPNDPFEELDRVDRVLPHRNRVDEWVPVFQDLVEAARVAYGTPSAAMSIIDDETTHYFARSGNVALSLPRGKTVCNRVMRIYGGLILPDARLDHRFVGLPEVRSGDVRFYAGYRITGPDGAPFGALCVFAEAPREVTDDDLTALRDLALEAQRRLWNVLQPA